MRRRRHPRAPRTLPRGFVIPEGVNLRLELAGARARAFDLDWLILLLTLIVATMASIYLLFGRSDGEVVAVLWLLGFFVLRNAMRQI